MSNQTPEFRLFKRTTTSYRLHLVLPLGTKDVAIDGLQEAPQDEDEQFYRRVVMRVGENVVQNDRITRDYDLGVIGVEDQNRMIEVTVFSENGIKETGEIAIADAEQEPRTGNGS
ncbi:MAG: hypothetical protein AAFV95_08295 [Bacteroidota bacterium]